MATPPPPTLPTSIRPLFASILRPQQAPRLAAASGTTLCASQADGRTKQAPADGKRDRFSHVSPCTRPAPRHMLPPFYQKFVALMTQRSDTSRASPTRRATEDEPRAASAACASESTTRLSVASTSASSAPSEVSDTPRCSSADSEAASAPRASVASWAAAASKAKSALTALDRAAAGGAEPAAQSREREASAALVDTAKAAATSSASSARITVLLPLTPELPPDAPGSGNKTPHGSELCPATVSAAVTDAPRPPEEAAEPQSSTAAPRQRKTKRGKNKRSSQLRAVHQEKTEPRGSKRSTSDSKGATRAPKPSHAADPGARGRQRNNDKSSSKAATSEVRAH